MARVDPVHQARKRYRLVVIIESLGDDHRQSRDLLLLGRELGEQGGNSTCNEFKICRERLRCLLSDWLSTMAVYFRICAI
jgi:hypothetical protein